jgi:hypothetical protein
LPPRSVCAPTSRRRQLGNVLRAFSHLALMAAVARIIVAKVLAEY